MRKLTVVELQETVIVEGIMKVHATLGNGFKR